MRPVAKAMENWLTIWVTTKEKAPACAPGAAPALMVKTTEVSTLMLAPVTLVAATPLFCCCAKREGWGWGVGSWKGNTSDGYEQTITSCLYYPTSAYVHKGNSSAP